MTNRSCLTAAVESEEPVRFTGPTAGVQRQEPLRFRPVTTLKGWKQTFSSPHSGLSNPALTLEWTGAHRQGAARRMLPRTACGALPVRVRVERPVIAHVEEISKGLN
jgi:hypothetical protein